MGRTRWTQSDHDGKAWLTERLSEQLLMKNPERQNILIQPARYYILGHGGLAIIAQATQESERTW